MTAQQDDTFDGCASGNLSDREVSGNRATTDQAPSDGAPDGMTRKSPRHAGIRVAPSSFKLDETPDQRDARIRRSLAILESLRAGSEEEAEEQRETLRLLMAALAEDRLQYPIAEADE